MISIFGNGTTNSPAQATPTQLASAPTQQPAMTRMIAPVNSINPKAAAALNSRHAEAVAVSPAAGKRRGFKWLQLGRTKKRLQMVETVSLGEKRFVALVQVDDRQFLIGGAPSNVGMLAELAPEESFHQVLRDATQGLNTPSAAPASEAAQRPSISAPEPLVTATVASAVAELSVIAEPRPIASTTETQKTFQPAGSVDDLSLEEPVSFSPSLLAAMQERQKSSATPEVQAQPETVQIAANTDISEPQAIPVSRESPFAAAPNFTFQLSHLFAFNSKLAVQPTQRANDPETTKRIAAAWNLQGATS